MKKLFVLLLMTAIITHCMGIKQSSNIDTDFRKCSLTNLGYDEIIPEKEIVGLQMIGKAYKYGVKGEGPNDKTGHLYGKLLRTLRFRNITEIAEKKYGLPENILLALIMQETGGVDILLNAQGDGGAGIVHMQANTARTFNLKTLKGCISSSSRDMACGRSLNELVKKLGTDRKKLIKHDDRFHPILNIDAAARYLKYYWVGKTNKEKEKNAIKAYCGAKNFNRGYYDNILYYMKALEDKNILAALEKQFNQENNKLLIGGKKGNYYLYIKTHQDQNINYGLAEYSGKKHDALITKQSEDTHTDFLNNEYLECGCKSLKFKDVIPEKKFLNLTMIPRSNPIYDNSSSLTKEMLYGSVLRASRFENITDSIEKRYGLPQHILLAMIIQDSGGDEFYIHDVQGVPGIGLFGFTEAIASEYGLNVLTSYDIKTHKTLVKAKNYDRKQLIAYDQRYHPVIIIDMAARFLLSKTDTSESVLDFSNVLRRKAESLNCTADNYVKNIYKIAEILQKGIIYKEAEREFNNLNNNLEIGELSGNFDLYIKTHQEQNINYGLYEY